MDSQQEPTNTTSHVVENDGEVLSYESITGSVAFEEIYNSEARRTDKLQSLVTFPEDNLITETFTKPQRTAYASRPAPEYEDKLDPYIKVCFECFSADWILVRSSYSGYQRFRAAKSIFDEEVPLFCGDDIKKFQLPAQKQLTLKSSGRARNVSCPPTLQEVEDAEASADDHIDMSDPHFNYVKPYTKRTDAKNKKKRLENRYALFEYYDPNYDWQPGAEVALCKRIRKTQRPDTSNESVKFKPFYFTVTPGQLAFQLGVLEPFFASLTLYQIDSKTYEVFQISEKFHFQNNSKAILDMLFEHWNPPNCDIQTNTALFSVTRRSKQVYLVLELSKVLQGDYENAIDPYNKIAASFKQKDQEKVKGKIKNEAADYCNRLGKYKQPFAWSILQVFDMKGNLLLTPDTKFTEIYARATKETIPNIVTQYDNALETKTLDVFSKKYRDLHGVFCFEINKFEHESFDTVRLVDTSLQIKKGEKASDDAPLLKEIHEFPQNASFVPNFFYINNMYVHLLTANLSSRNGKTVVAKLQVKDTDQDINAPGLKCICDPYSNCLVDEIYSTAHYRNKAPIFSNEFKLILPPKLTSQHHILFTFYNITVNKKKRTEYPETPIAYVVIPLYPDGRIVVHNIEGCYGANLLSKLEPDYVTKILSEPPPTAGKASVVVRFNLVSTIFPEDKSITEFLNIYHTSEDDVPDKVLVEVLQRLQDLSELLAIQYLPVIINNLLEVMVTRSNNKPQFEAFRTLVMVTHKVRTKLQESGVPRTALLELYSNYIFRQTFTTNHAVFKAICSNFLLYLMDFTGKDLSEIKPDSLFVNSWFFFDIVVKSMALKLKEENKLNQPQRKGLFDDIYVRTLSQLLKNLAKYFKEQMSINPDIRILNKNLALFMNDLFSVFDRGIVLDMIRAYLRDMTNPSQELLSTTFKVEFLRIISDNEHYIPLNLLFCTIDDLTVNTLTQRHPVAYTVIFNVLQTMKSSDPEVWPLATDALYDVVVKNAFDARYQDTESQERIAAMYFVLIPMFIDAWDSFTQWRKGSSKLAKREFYICILYVLRTCNRDMLTTWWRGEITTNQVLFLELLRDIVITFEYFPELKRPTKTLLTPEVALFINKVGTEEMREILRCISKKEEDDAAEDKRLRLLTIEVNILVLDVLENFISDVRHSIQRNLSTNSIMSRIVDVLCAQMNCKQSPNFVHHLYASLRSFAYKFADVLFKGDNEYLSLLLEQILMHCNAPEPDVNIEASSMLFILLKLNQKTTGSFGRTKIQAIATLSNLVQSKQIEKDIVLYRSFNRLTEYALHSYSTLQFRDISPNTTLEDDHVAHAAFSSFSRGIQDMCETFTCILRDTLRVNEISETEDKHMIADLYYQIADGYKHTPDLRLTWLKKLTALQQSNHNNVEAGITFSHAAALIADYLISSGKLDGKLFNMNVFSLVSPNIKEFSNAEEEGVCQSADFSTDGLRRMVSCAIGCFESAEYYEFAAHLFKIITPLDEKTQSYRQLAQSYEKLRNFWQKVNEENEMRLFGKYFRVGFFGSGFGELNGREFVYKEPKLTHILELTDTLKTLYGKNTKEEIQHLDAGADLSKIDTSKEYLQITKIDPYIIEENRETFFEQNTNLANFVYETPFTQSGKSHADDVSQQFKRKTILTVAGSFPSMLTRLPVIRKRDVIVTPIENAIEDVEKRNAHIATEVNRNPVNPKTLTQVLQGSALPQVNEGALSICKIFLTNFTGQPAVHVLTLAESLTKFLNLVREGLSRNKEIINTDHDKKFHFEMEAGFKQLEAEINQYIGQIQVDKNDDPSSESSVLTQDDDITDDSDISLHRKIRRTTSRKRGHTLIVPGTSSESQTTKAPKSDQYPRRKKSSELKNSFPPAEGSQANSFPELKVKKGEQVIAPSALVLPAVPPPSHDSPAPSPISAKHAPIPAPLVKVSIDVGDSPSTALRPKGTPKLPAHKKPPPPAVPPPPAE